MRGLRDRKRKALTRDEQALFLNYLRNDPKYRHWYPVFAIILGTGMRVGEATGLRWQDIDLEKRTIDINHTLVYYSHGKKEGCSYAINTPKTQNSYRTIPMLDSVYEAFLMERHFQNEAGLKSRSVVDGYNDFIFINRFGDVQNGAILNKALNRIIRDCNEELMCDKANPPEYILPHFSCHSLRHPYVKHTTKNISLQKQKSQTTNRFDSLGVLFSLNSMPSIKLIIVISANQKSS